MERFVAQKLRGQKVENMLIAPCGSGNDFEYLGKFSKNTYGIDLSPSQIEKCPKQMKVKVGDILETGYADEQFDFIASPFFFHHIVHYGFDAFLREFHRVLKIRGKLKKQSFAKVNEDGSLEKPYKKIAHTAPSDSFYIGQIPSGVALEDMEGACPGMNGEVRLTYYPIDKPGKKIRT